MRTDFQEIKDSWRDLYYWITKILLKPATLKQSCCIKAWRKETFWQQKFLLKDLCTVEFSCFHYVYSNVLERKKKNSNVKTASCSKNINWNIVFFLFVKEKKVNQGPLKLIILVCFCSTRDSNPWKISIFIKKMKNKCFVANRTRTLIP